MKVIVLLITYRRLSLALETIRSIKEKLIYPDIGFHIADDGSGPEYINRLKDELKDYEVTVSDSARAGVGKNMNLGIQACLKRADFWLHLEDDWVLKEPLDLRPCVQLLEENPTIGMVRLGRLTANIKGEVLAGANKLWWNLFKNSDTYVFNGNASLRHRRFYETYGPYMEGLRPGETELSYCNRFFNTTGPSIVHPAWLSTEQTFFHIGDSQSFKWWMETGGISAEEAAKKFEDMK